MDNTLNSPAQLPKIVRYLDPLNNGIQPQTLSRYALGYVFRGVKYIYEGDRRHVIASGDLFYLDIGRHYIENCPKNGQPFEQIVLFYTPPELQRMLLHLHMTYGLDIADDHGCEQCCDKTYVSAPARNAVRDFFTGVDRMLHDEEFDGDQTAESLKMTELVYLVVSSGASCIKHKLLTGIDAAKENFEQIIYDRIFKDISIGELAKLTNRSLTSFKKEFYRHFHMPPHQWFIRRRLMHARLLLISSSQSVSEIGNACLFPNTSHFIKLFKKEYRLTPATYRSRHRESQNPMPANADELLEKEEAAQAIEIS